MAYVPSLQSFNQFCFCYTTCSCILYQRKCIYNTYKQKFHQAEILLGAVGNEPITLKVELRTPNKPSKGLSHPTPPGRE